MFSILVCNKYSAPDNLFLMTLTKTPQFPKNANNILEICEKKPANDNCQLRGPCLVIQQLSQHTHMESRLFPFPDWVRQFLKTSCITCDGFSFKN